MTLKAKTDEFQAKIGSAGKKLGQVISMATRPIDTLTLALGKVSPAAAGIAAGAILAGAALDKLASHTLMTVKAQAQLADSLGVSISAVQKLENAFNRVGVDASTTRSAVKSWEALFASAKMGSQDAIDRIEALGLSMKTLEKVNPTEGFKAFLDVVAKIGTLQEQQAALTLVVKDNAEELSKVTRLGSEAMNEQIRATNVVGIEGSNQLLKYADLQNKIGESFRRWGDETSLTILPALTKGWQAVDWAVSKAFRSLKSVYNLGRSISDVLGLSNKALQTQLNAVATKTTEQTKIQLEASLKVKEALRAGDRQLSAFRNDEKAILDEINLAYATATEEERKQLIIQRAVLENKKVQAKIDDKASSIRAIRDPIPELIRQINLENQLASGAQKRQLLQQHFEEASIRHQIDQEEHLVKVNNLLDDEAVRRHQINRDNKLLTEEQRKQILLREREAAAVDRIQAKLKESIGGREIFEFRDLARERQTGQLSEAQYRSDVQRIRDSRNVALGEVLTPEQMHRQRMLDLKASPFLTDKEREQGERNSERQKTLDSRTYLEGLGKFTSQIERFQQSIEAAQIELNKGKITDAEFARIRSDLYKTQVDPGPRTAQTFEAGSVGLYDRLSKFFSGLEDRPLEKQIAENGKRATVLLERIEQKLPQANVEKPQTIR